MFNAVGPDGNVALGYNQTNYPGFFEVNYGSEASNVNESLCEIIGMSDYFPPLSDGPIVYRSFVTLQTYLNNPANAGLLMTSTFLFRDPLKQLIWDLGQVAIKCRTMNIELDTSLDRIFVVGNDSPRIKAIASVTVSDDKSWSTKLLKLYDDIRVACVGGAKPDDNFLDFLNQFRNSPNLRLTQDVFQSHTFFWTTCKKVQLINRIDDMLDSYHKIFFKFVQGDLGELLTWREQVRRDPDIGGILFQEYEPRTGSGDDDDEIYLMLKYFRSNIAHFQRQILGHNTRFTDVLELVEHYDQRYPKIMAAIYKVIKAMTKANHYPFDLDRQA